MSEKVTSFGDSTYRVIIYKETTHAGRFTLGHYKNSCLQDINKLDLGDLYQFLEPTKEAFEWLKVNALYDGTHYVENRREIVRDVLNSGKVAYSILNGLDKHLVATFILPSKYNTHGCFEPHHYYISGKEMPVFFQMYREALEKAWKEFSDEE
jgi:hypothetical protein